MKTWGGLEREYHQARYQLFVDQAVAALSQFNRSAHVHAHANQPRHVGPSSSSAAAAPAFNETKFKEHFFKSFLNFAIDWDNTEWSPASLPTTPVGDPVAISERLLAKYQ